MGNFSKFIEQCCEELEYYGLNTGYASPKISVIVPAYNVEDYIYDCLISLIKQTFKDIEIIVINDGSTDNTRSIIKMFMQFDKRIRLIDKKNNGVGSARNDGLKAALGECVLFVDSDDIVKDKDSFEKIYQKYVENCVDIVVFGALNLKNDKFRKSSYGIGKISKKLKKRIIEQSESQEVIFKLPVLCMCKLYSRKFLQENKIYFQEGCIGEDQIFFIKSILLAKNLYIINENYYGYRRSRNNSLTFCKKKNDNSVILNFYAIEGFLRNQKYPQKLIDKILDLYFEKCVSWLGKCEKSYRNEYFNNLFELMKFVKRNYPQLRVNVLKINKNDNYLILKLKLIEYKLRRFINGKSQDINYCAGFQCRKIFEGMFKFSGKTDSKRY